MEAKRQNKIKFPSMHIYLTVFTFVFMVISVLALSYSLFQLNKEVKELKEELDVLRESYLQDPAAVIHFNATRVKRQVNRYNRYNRYQQNRYRNQQQNRYRNQQQSRYNRNQQQSRYNRNQQQNRYNRNQQQNRYNRNQQQNRYNRNQQQNRYNRNQQQNRNTRVQQNRGQQNRNQQNRYQQNRNLQNRNQPNRNVKTTSSPSPPPTTTPPPPLTTTSTPTQPKPTNKTGSTGLTAILDLKKFWSIISKQPLTTTCKRVIKEKKTIVCVKADGKNITIDPEGRRIINGTLDLGTVTVDRGSVNLISAGKEVSTGTRNYVNAYVDQKLKMLLGTKITDSKHLDQFIQTKVQEAIDARLKSGLVASSQIGKAQIIAIAGPPGPRGFPGPRGYRGPRGYSGPRGAPGLAAVVGPGGRVRWISSGNTGLFVGVSGRRRSKRQAGLSITGTFVGRGSSTGGASGTGGAGAGGAGAGGAGAGGGRIINFEELFGGLTETKPVQKSPFDNFFAPNITKPPPKKVMIKVGESYNVTVRVKGYPAPESFWMKESTREMVFSPRLSFDKAKIEDSGIWTFRTRNLMGTATAQLEFIVAKKPSFVVVPKRNVLAYVGRTFEFRCHVDGNPKPQIGWKRRGNAKIPVGRHKIIKDTLYLTDPKPEDAGVYLCRAANVLGAVIGGSNVYVQKILPLRTKVLSPPEVVYKDTSKPLQLNCSATGNPPPNITWYKDGVALKARKYVKRPTRRNQLPEFVSELILKQVSTKDEGTYTCSIHTSLAPQPVEYNTTVSLFKCKPLQAPANGYIVGNQFHVGGCVKFACNPGCMLYGSTIRVCNKHGKWSGTAPTCYDVGEVAYECHHYNVLDDSDRNVNSKRVLGRCDNNLAEGWYRMGGEAGTQMPTSCQGPRRCNAKYPGWMFGQHPRKEDGCIQTHVCFGDFENKCCAYKQKVLVRNCGKFYVYKFSPTPGCNMRYCAKD